MDTHAKSTSSPRLIYLDALRGIAAGSVAFKHYLLVFGIPPIFLKLQSFLPQNFYADGSPEVAFFFVLSGFVLALGYFDGRKNISELNIWQTYFSRGARIYPAFLAVFLLSWLLKPFLYSHLASDEHLRILNYYWPQDLSLSHILKQLSLMHFSDRGTPLVSPDWTLISEVKYSLLLPFLLLVAHKSRLWFLIFTGFLILALGEKDYLLSGFSIGILIASMFQFIYPQLKSTTAFVKILILLAILALYFISPLLPIPQMLTASLAGGLVLCLAFSSLNFQNFLNTLPLKFLGKISYSIYLSHFFVLLGIAPYWRTWVLTLQYGLALDILFSALATILISSFFYYSAEKPGIWLGKIKISK